MENSLTKTIPLTLRWNRTPRRHDDPPPPLQLQIHTRGEKNKRGEEKLKNLDVQERESKKIK